MKFFNNLKILSYKLYKALSIFKIKAFLLFFLIIITTFTEAFSISIIYPLIESLVSTDSQYNKINDFLEFFKIDFNIYSMLFILFISISIKNLLLICRYYVEEDLGAFLRHTYMIKISKNILNGDFIKVSKYKVGSLNSILINETANMTVCLRAFVRMISGTFLLIFLFFVFLYFNQNSETFLLLIIFVLIFFLLRPISRFIKRLGKKRINALQNYSSFFSDYIVNYKQIKLLGFEKKSFENLHKFSYEFIKIIRLSKFITQLSRPILETFFVTAIIILILFYLIIANFNINQILPILGLFIVIGYRSIAQVDNVAKSLFALSSYIASFDKIEKLISELEIEEEDINLKILDNYNKDIIFENISFRYNKDFIFKDFNLKIPAKSNFLIKGKSGSGKSTLIDLIVKLQKPESGKINIGNENIQNLETKNLRKKIAYVSQEVLLFNDTIYENIKSVKPDLSNEEFEKYSRLTISDQFINNLIDGKNFKVGERGSNLSGGQRQRIGILRSIVNKPDIIILDESTNALDSQISYNLLNNILNNFKESTIIFIAHEKINDDLFDISLDLDNIKISDEKK